MSDNANKHNYTHAFNVGLATKYGVNCAIMLNNFLHWTLVNMANKNNYRDGRYWTYNTIEAFTSLFPYWSGKSIRINIDNLVATGLIDKGNYNKQRRDRTIWYCLTDKGLSEVGIGITPAVPDKASVSELSTGICPKGQSQLPDRTNPFAQKGDALPDTDPYAIADRSITAKRSRFIFTKEQKEVRELVIAYTGNKSFRHNQAKQLLECRSNDGKLATVDTIRQSLDNYKVYLAINGKEKVKNILGYFLKSFLNDGYFCDPRQFTKIKDPNEVRAHENELNKNMNLEGLMLQGVASNSEFKSFEEMLAETEAELGFSLTESVI